LSGSAGGLIPTGLLVQQLLLSARDGAMLLRKSIMKAHTIVAAPGYTVKEGKAAMGNYNHFLTIQELIDLVAFLKEGTKADGK
jgi:hypothetical protein